MMFARRMGFSLAALFMCAAAALAAPDASVWQELDIVPMPKEIELTGREVPVSGCAIVLGRDASRQDEIGAKWIADEIVRLGGAAPQVVRVGDETGAGLRVVVGTRESNPLIAAAADELDVGAGNPGERGYVIAASEGTVLLAGADNIGALYACVTFGELLAEREGGVVWREAQVRDWPDWVKGILGDCRIGSTMMPEIQRLFSRLLGTTVLDEGLTEKVRTEMAWYYDWLLRRKVPGLHYMMSTPRGLEGISPEVRAILRERIDYGKERGIGALLYATHPFAGLVSEHPEYAEARPCLPPGRYPKWIRCWSLDDMRRQYAEEYAKAIGDIGLTDIGFHDSDTGGYLSPARWNERCETCRERWGDDYAAATIHKHRIHYDALKKYAPDAIMHATVYPYNISVMAQEGAEAYIASHYGAGPGVEDQGRQLQEKWTEFWRRLHAELPEDMTFAIRETTGDNVQAFREMIGDRSILFWYGAFNYPYRWTSLYSDFPTMVGAFYGNSGDYLYPMAVQTTISATAQAIREYSWNVNAPGAQPWRVHDGRDGWLHSEPEGEVFDIVLPHVTRNLFGRRFGDELTKVLALNVCAHEVFADHPEVLRSAEQMQWQADNAAEGMRIMDEIWAQREDENDLLGWDEWTFRRILYLREMFHCVHHMAAARAQNMLARELARQGKADEAQAAVARGKELVADAVADEQMLLAVRPEDAIYVWKDGNNWMRQARAFTPSVNVDYSKAQRELEQTEKELPTLTAGAGVAADALKHLDVNRRVQVSRVAGGIAVDGILNEAAWQTAYPTESFFVLGEGRRIASAHTRVRLLQDGERLYVGASCWVPDGAEPVAQQRERDGEILQDDALDIFLLPGVPSGCYAHFMVNALGCWRDTRLDPVAGGGGPMRYTSHPEWSPQSVEMRTMERAGRWDVEMSIALADLGGIDGRAWRANFAREYLSAAGTRERSSILPTNCEDFHDLSKYRAMVFSPEGFAAPGADVVMEFSHPKIATRTLPDGIATVCSFGVDMRSSRVLHDALLSVELYGEDGKLHLQRELAESQAILYSWEPEDEFEVAFELPVERGGIRLVLETDEGVFEQWMRLGDWEGTDEVGAVLRDGALVGRAALASKVFPAGPEVAVDILNEREGTIEFWFLPEWAGQTFGFYKQSDASPVSHVLLHFGPMRREAVHVVNHSSLTVSMLATSRLRVAVDLPQYAGWSVLANLDGLEGWDQQRWHHLAVVWDADSPLADGLRIYMDGKRVDGEVQVSKPDRIENPEAVRVHTDEPYSIQLGSVVNGRGPGGVQIDDLRISRVARYANDFDPREESAELDAETTALLEFDGNLVGLGVGADGAEYQVRAVAGAVEYH